LLNKFEDSIQQESDEFGEFIGILWRSVQEKLARSEELDFEEKRTALKWLGRAAMTSKREEYRSNIVRGLEDNLLQAVSFVWKTEDGWTEEVPGELEDADVPPELAVQFAIPRIIPLVETNLIDETDPLIRRIVGFVARHEGEGLVPYTISDERLEQEIEVEEDELEESALEVFKAGLSGDPRFRNMLYAGGVEFRTTEEANTLDDEQIEVPVDFDATLFRLLLREEEKMQSALLNALEQQLINVDPALAVRLAQYGPRILAEDEEDRTRALEGLSLDVLNNPSCASRRRIGKTPVSTG